MRSIIISLLVLILCEIAFAQQVPDSAFRPTALSPAFPPELGPIVMIDQAHNNFHTADGRYLPFANLLRIDGYRVLASGCAFNRDSLRRGAILVIANALNERNREDWSLPTPSAFTPEEITAVKGWVEEGGSLLLIADHMPFPGCAEDLAREFGFTLSNGFAAKADSPGGNDYFRRADGTLADHPITNGKSKQERIDSVVSFTGEAFTGDSSVTGLMIFGQGMASYMPQVAWQFNDSTPKVDITGWYQAAVREFGKGRVAMVGEAAMFTAQLAGPERRQVGMNQAEAAQNSQFLLNMIHWLSRIL
ncbi:MAG: DUF4350 domain-containing protein [bacterium]|nr:DUF4350 domain-containing protein [bacterium]